MESSRSFPVVVTVALCATCITLAASCTDGTSDRDPGEAAVLPQWTFDASMIFPGDGSLARPEDGVALADGRLIVADQVYGLRRIELDGTSAPFGEMVAAGYVHNPPERSGGANGVSLEPDGTHLLVADIFDGGIEISQHRPEVGPRLVLLTAQPAYEHESEIETCDRQACIRGLMIIGSCGGQVLVDPPAMVQHGAERIGGSSMAVIGGLAHGLDGFQEQFPALPAAKQSLSAFKIEEPLIHAGTLDQTSRLASQKTQFCHNKSICARFSGTGMTGAPWALVCAPEPAESRIA